MRMGCRRNVASPPARVSLLSAGWDAIRPPRRCHCCHCCAEISTVAHPRHPPNAHLELSSSSPGPREGINITRLGSKRQCDAVHPLSQLHERRERTPEDQGDRSSPSHALRRPLFPSSPPLQGCSLLSLAGSTTLRAYILETLSDVRSTNHLRWLSCAGLGTPDGKALSLSSSASSCHFPGDSGDVDPPRVFPHRNS